MKAKIIDGVAIASKVRAEWKQRAAALSSQGCQPGLAVIIIGDDPASHVYVRNKAKACSDNGIRSAVHALPRTTPETELLALIEALNRDRAVHGILVQLPLPAHIRSAAVLGAIAADKDVDGFHLYNVGALVTGNAIFSPCTPFGVMKLLECERIPVSGQHAVIIGASNIVGKPMAAMLLEAGATVTICHVKTRDLASHARLADILVVATGNPKLVTADMVKPGAVVVDVGINRLRDGRIVGDVDFAGLLATAGHITPVPGGVGPMTITMLLVNTIRAAAAAHAGPSSHFKDQHHDTARVHPDPFLP